MYEQLGGHVVKLQLGHRLVQRVADLLKVFVVATVQMSQCVVGGVEPLQQVARGVVEQTFQAL